MKKTYWLGILFSFLLLVALLSLVQAQEPIPVYLPLVNGGGRPVSVPVTATISAEQGGSLSIRDGVTTTASFPPGLVDETLTASMQVVINPPTTSGQYLLGPVISIEARTQDGQLVTQFPISFTITIEYQDKDVIYIEENRLTLSYWNEATRQWNPIVSDVDVGNNRLTAELDHLTFFAVLEENRSTSTSTATSTSTSTPVPSTLTPTPTSTPTSTPIPPTLTPTSTPTATDMPAIVEHCGAILSDELWSTGLVHQITCEVTVEYGVTLTVENSVVVKFLDNALLRVNGTLNVVGTADQPIIFTSIHDDSVGGDTNNNGNITSPAPGDWQKVEINGSASFDYAVLRYGGGIGILHAWGGSLSVNNSTVSHSGSVGIYVGTSASVSITHSDILDNTTDGIYTDVTSPESLSLVENRFDGNGGYAISIYSPTSTDFAPAITGNTASNNRYNGIGLSGEFGTLILPNEEGLPYIITGSWSYYGTPVVTDGSTLTFEPGSVVKFLDDALLRVDGSLNVVGTVDQPIILTSIHDDSVGGDTNNDGNATSPVGGDWSSIDVSDSFGNGEATFNYSIIRYGGGTSTGLGMINNTGGSLSISNSTFSESAQHGLAVYGGSLSLSNSTISHSAQDGIFGRGTVLTGLSSINNHFANNGGYAIAFDYPAAPTTAPIISGNTASNNGYNGIGLSGEIGTLTLPNNEGLPYIITGGWSYYSTPVVMDGATLTFEPGTVVKFLNGALLRVDGTMNAVGTADRPIIFTSIHDDNVGGDTNNNGNITSPDGGDWSSIDVSDSFGNGEATFNYSIIRYGGGTSTGLGMINNTGGSLSISNSTFSESAQHGLAIYGGSLSLSNSTIRYSSQDGIFVNQGSVVIQQNRIFGNGMYGVYNADVTTVVNARNNWWGSPSGPDPYGAGNGINYEICYRDVSYYDYLSLTWYTESVPYICHYYVDVVPWQGQVLTVQPQLGQSGPNTNNQLFVADPVNTASGNYVQNTTDLEIATRGVPLNFSRAYNSLNPQNGPLGYGWTHSWHIYLTEFDDGQVLVTFGDGHGESWSWSGSAYDGAAGVFGALVKNGDGSFSLTQKGQNHYDFNSDGRLTQVEERNGNRTVLTYDAQGRLTTITEPAGRVLSLSYTSPISSSLISQITDPAGRTVAYVYNAAGDLTAVTDANSATTTMTYDSEHRLLTVTDANGHTFVNNVYDINGRVIEQYDALNNPWTFAYDDVDRETWVTDPLSRTTIYDYDDELRLVSERDALGQSTAYVYDGDGNRLQMTDKRGNTTSAAYDGVGNRTILTDTSGFSTTYTYDAHNNLLNRTDALGGSTSFTYDANNNLIELVDALGNITTYSYDNLGQLLTMTDALSRTIGYGYDVYGNQSIITDALGSPTTFVHDLVGRLTTETDASGRTTTYTYDNVNRLLARSEPMGKITQYGYDVVGNRTAITDAVGGITTFVYDAKDQLTSTTSPIGSTTTYSYDAVNNQIAVADPLGHMTTFGYDALDQLIAVTDPLSHTTTYAYDANGNQSSRVDANGHITNYTYDEMNRLVSVTDAEGSTVTYGYDAVGNRTSVVDANGHVTTYSHDVLNRVTSVTDSLGNTTTYAYDAVGNRTSYTKADNTVINVQYNDLDRPIQTSYPGETIRYDYDAVGNRIGMTDTVGVTTYLYDSLNRQIQVTTPSGSIGYTYDLKGNRTGITYPEGNIVTYTYKLNDLLDTVTDWRGNVITYTYDAAGRRTAAQNLNGTASAYVYNDAGQLTSLWHASPISGTFAVFTYTLDAVGNRLSMVDLNGTTTYSYDNLDRLTGVTYSDGETVTYAYDAMGNRISMTSSVNGTTTYVYDDADRLLSTTDDNGTLTLNWDANGNLISKGNVTYTFDALDRLTQVVSDTLTVTFAYNGDNVRQSKTVNSTVTNYVQDTVTPLPMMLMETTETLSNTYLYGAELVAQFDATDNAIYYHSDGLGSIRALSNDDGQRTSQYSYDALGQIRDLTGTDNQPFTFAGEQKDDEIELIYLRARYYDPVVGRFINRDAYPALARETQTLNRYVYVQNNPVRFTDPSGNAWYDALNPKKNGINQTIGSFIGNYIIGNMPGIGNLYHAGSELGNVQKDSQAVNEAALNGEWDEDAYQSLQTHRRKVLSNLSGAVMNTPCTSFRPDCGISSLAPEPVGDLYTLWKNPFTWLLNLGKDAVIDPIYDVPSLWVEHQFNRLPNHAPYSVGGGAGGGGGGSWGGPPSRQK